MFNMYYPILFRYNIDYDLLISFPHENTAYYTF